MSSSFVPVSESTPSKQKGNPCLPTAPKLSCPNHQSILFTTAPNSYYYKPPYESIRKLPTGELL